MERCVVTNVGPTPESDLHVTVVVVEVGQVGSRVELFEVIRRDARLEGLSIRELAIANPKVPMNQLVLAGVTILGYRYPVSDESLEEVLA